MIAENQRQLVGAECGGVLQDEDQLSQRVDPASFGDAVGGAYDLAVEGCVNLSSPPVALSGAYADDEPAKNSSGVVAETTTRVDLEQVIGETLAQDVGPVARDAITGRIDGHPPFTAEWEVDDDRSIHLVGHASMLRAGRDDDICV